MKLPEDYELKYRISRFVPTRFRNAVLNRFSVMWEGVDMLTVRLSYYHLKQKTTLDYQLRFHKDEFEGVLPLFSAAQMMLRELKKAGRRI